VAIQDGLREGEQSWRKLLLDLEARGLAHAPKVAVGDGALNFCATLRKVFGETREQRCRMHKTANVQGRGYAFRGRYASLPRPLVMPCACLSKAQANLRCGIVALSRKGATRCPSTSKKRT
jgi:hypothetical protein